EDPAEVVVPRELLQRAARIGDRRELASLTLRLLPEMREMGQRLGGLARLRRDDEQRATDGDLLLDRKDGRGVGGVEHVEPRVSLDRQPERVAQHVWAQR